MRMTRERISMKLLRIEDNHGQFLSADGSYESINKITKDDLLRIMERVLDENGELDQYEQGNITNQAHQVVYKSIYSNLKALLDRRQEFADESERMYLEDYKRYVDDASQSNPADSLCVKGE